MEYGDEYGWVDWFLVVDMDVGCLLDVRMVRCWLSENAVGFWLSENVGSCYKTDVNQLKTHHLLKLKTMSKPTKQIELLERKQCVQC